MMTLFHRAIIKSRCRPFYLLFLNRSATSTGNTRRSTKPSVSVLDRGFIFGDGIYDVVPVYGRKLFRFAEHLARLERNLGKLRIPNPHTTEAWMERCRKLIAAHASEDQMIYIQVTRGVAVRDHVMPKDIVPTVFIMASAMKAPSAQAIRDGVACVTAEDFRWERGDIKSTSLLGNVMARQVSADVGATETILFAKDNSRRRRHPTYGWCAMVRCSACPRASTCSKGFASSSSASCARRRRIAFSLQPITQAEVRGADELMLSSASKEVLAVTWLDDALIGTGAPGGVFKRLHAAYQWAKESQAR